MTAAPIAGHKYRAGDLPARSVVATSTGAEYVRCTRIDSLMLWEQPIPGSEDWTVFYRYQLPEGARMTAREWSEVVGARLGPEIRRVVECIERIRRDDCDFIDPETLRVYTGCTVDEYRAAVVVVMGQDWLTHQDRVTPGPEEHCTCSIGGYQQSPGNAGWTAHAEDCPVKTTRLTGGDAIAA